jgi:hypothetical protein
MQTGSMFIIDEMKHRMLKRRFPYQGKCICVVPDFVYKCELVHKRIKRRGVEKCFLHSVRTRIINLKAKYFPPFEFKFLTASVQTEILIEWSSA